MRVVVASTNEGKVREIRHVLEPLGWDVVRAADLGAEALEVEETGSTFLENALLKARAYAEHFGCVALADDSGLEVDALGGAPGVRSARYAGEPSDDAANNAKLLAELADVPAGERTARFRCVVALVWPDGRVLAADGVCEGAIGFEPRGSGGFGYDPLFWPAAAPGRTMAELSPAEKSAISHRGSALRALRAALEQGAPADG
ncbi:XTP/dITP diphosphatase [Coriobacteriia bacterium Es71-Z0120]|uniref:XTP/dITP diphosphatase n=1 Tax=Parvivirga hydrogeniphila TaxID=2939460 RepID=UPI002260B346|nr:XTP/dITP diphosphatase [Parvivirga hydrogeniphila]MCL4078757.1 XTP/dITP diphosphatase [Parvivirga hydrogeniphila]